MKIQSFISLALVLPLGACVVVSNDTDSGTESATSTTSSSSSTSTSADTETSGATSTSGGTDSDSAGSTTADATATDPTATSTADTTGSTTADTDTDGTTTGGDPEAILESCQAACEALLECYPDEFEELDFCVELCVDESTPLEPDAECEAATIALNKCIGTATCEDFESPDFCGPEGAEEDAACGGGDGECFGGAGANMEGTECEVSEECVGEFKHELICTVDTCECYEDDVKTQECEPQVNLCADFDPSALEDYALECCGW